MSQRTAASAPIPGPGQRVTGQCANAVPQHGCDEGAGVRAQRAIRAYGHPHLAVVPLVCFEWLQRPDNILAGYLRWTDYRPSERPAHVRIVHHKTGEVI